MAETRVRNNWTKAIRDLAWAHFPRDPRLVMVIWSVAIFVLGVAILSVALTPARFDLKAGEVAPQDIAAPRTVVNRLATQQAREAAAALVPDQYEIDPQMTSDAEAAVAAVFASIRKANSSPPAAYTTRATGLTEDCAVYGITLSDEAVAAALAASSERVDVLETSLRGIIENVMQSGVKREFVDAAKAQAEAEIGALDASTGEKVLLRSVADVVIIPNMVFNATETQAKREEAMAAVAPSEILKGQIIVRGGDVVTSDHISILQDLGLLRDRPSWGALFGISLIVFLLEAAVALYLVLFEPGILRSGRRLSLLGLLVVMTMVLCAWTRSLSGYALPVAAGTMLVTLLLNARLAIFMSLVFAPFAGLLVGNDLRFALVACLGGLVGAFSVSRLGQRSDLMRGGLLVAGVNVLAVAAVDVLGGQGLVEMASLRDILWGAGSGVVSAILTIGCLPFLEDIFGVLTGVKLLELANPNQPLLRRLLMEAPGTYHHSIIVGNLAESAALEVGGNTALVRAGAYYHDIGKARRPYFFIDNQFGGDNPHDKIAPSLSALIITSHVRDGVAMAEEAGLPQEVIDLIQQHHGNSLVSYFYTRAAESGDSENILEADFRYDGPRPVTREAAILMLADSCEAAVRSLIKPTPGRIEGLVRKIVKDRLDDGQLEESPLTLQDLNRIATVFSRVLAGVFHRRVEYPDWAIRELRGKTQNGRGARNGNGRPLKNGEKKVV